MQIEGPPQVARRSDMDMNGHINNVTYLGWALETIPEDVANNYNLHQVWARRPIDTTLHLPASCAMTITTARVSTPSTHADWVEYVSVK